LILAVTVMALFLSGCGGERSDSESGSGPGVFSTQETWTFDEDPPGEPPQGSEVFGGTW